MSLTGDDSPVFTGPMNAPLRRSNFTRAWRGAIEAARLTDTHFHDLRHAGNNLAAATGASLRELPSRVRLFAVRPSWTAPVIWLPVTMASVVATCVIRFGNTKRAQALSCSRSSAWRPPALAPSAAGWRAAAGQVQGGASSQVSVMCSL